MDIFSLISIRQSIRSYEEKTVENEKVMMVLEAGRQAPSAVNNQPWYFVVLKGSEQISRLKYVYSREWFLKVPVVIVVCCDRQNAWKRRDGKSYGDVDAAIAMDHMILAATALGLGTCWIGAFDSAKASEALKLPSHIEPVAMTPLGYSGEVPTKKARKSIKEIVRWGDFDTVDE